MLHRIAAAAVHRLVQLVVLAGQVDQPGLLELAKQRLRRQRKLRRADRVAAGDQQGAAEQVGVSEGKAQGDARATGESADVDVLRVDRVALGDVVGSEQGERFARFNDTAYNLEPNLKEGPGGLRTLDLLRWLGKRITRAADFDAMATQGVLDPTERAALDRSEATLRRYRYALHLAAGRAEERLLFDHQRALAAELGFRDEHEKNLAVEQFMQGYYRAATVVERLGAQVTERFMELLDPPGEPRGIDRDFVAVGARLEPRSATLFERRPRAFHELITRTPMGWRGFVRLASGDTTLARALAHPSVRLGLGLLGG